VEVSLFLALVALWARRLALPFACVASCALPLVASGDDQATRRSVENPAASCPVTDCPADLTGLSPDDRAICDPKDWAMKQIGMERVWADPEMRKITGRSVKIAHIDTGYTTHPALPILGSVVTGAPPTGAFCTPFGDLPDLAGVPHGVSPGEGYDYFVGCPKPEECGPRTEAARMDPRDPLLQPHFIFDRQPAHGTGTLGMIASPGVCLSGTPQKTADRFLIGVAPGATVVPLRVSDGVIMTEDRTTRTAEAIYNAAGTQVIVPAAIPAFRPLVDVITISHGRRSPTSELEVAIRTAEQNGVILVAASGEYPFFSPVRFPAQYPTVVGVTGTRVDGTPWSGIFGAGRGPSAKVAAPAYRVWHADTVLAAPGKQCATAATGKGTSFSAPLVAGAAALWLEKYNTPAAGEAIGPLAKAYGLSAVPSLFRHFLRPQRDPRLSGFRSPAELCELAQEDKWPNEASVCAHKQQAWDTHDWGQGVVAVDKLLSPRFPDDFPTPAELCREVYREEGDSAFQLACPLNSPGRQEDETTEAGSILGTTPHQEEQESWTRLAGASFGRPFGSHAGWGPALDYALIFSRHYYRKPSGVLLQGAYGQGGNLSIGLGYGAGFGYDPYRDSKRSWSVIPGFGPAASIGLKAVYMRARTELPGHANMVGAQAQAGLLKVKGSAGIFRDLDNNRWRLTWDLGFGY
jgi:subtilisin family serine protease